MQMIIPVVLGALVLGLVLLLWRLAHLRRLVVMLDEDVEELAKAWSTLPPDLKTLLPAARRTLISVEILNPIEVAARQSILAQSFGSLTPGVVRGLVHQRTMNMMREILDQYGVKAEVRLHGSD